MRKAQERIELTLRSFADYFQYQLNSAPIVTNTQKLVSPNRH